MLEAEIPNEDTECPDEILMIGHREKGERFGLIMTDITTSIFDNRVAMFSFNLKDLIFSIVIGNN